LKNNQLRRKTLIDNFRAKRMKPTDN